MKTFLIPVRLMCLLTLLLVAPGSAAMDMFLEVIGEPIKGESQDRDFKGAIDITSFSWGLTMPVTTSRSDGGGATVGRANFQELSLTKWVDTSTTGLMTALAKGTTIKQVRLTVRNLSAKDRPGDRFFVINLFNVVLSRIETSAASSDGRLPETVTLNAGMVQVDYTSQDKSIPAGKFGWSVVKNAPFVAP